MREKYFITCMNLDTQLKRISIFHCMHESSYPIKLHIQITGDLDMCFYWISRFMHSMKCK